LGSDPLDLAPQKYGSGKYGFGKVNEVLRK